MPQNTQQGYWMDEIFGLPMRLTLKDETVHIDLQHICDTLGTPSEPLIAEYIRWDDMPFTPLLIEGRWFVIEPGVLPFLVLVSEIELTLPDAVAWQQGFSEHFTSFIEGKMAGLQNAMS